MKTLNERVYETLLKIGEPVTLSQLNHQNALKDVPRMALGESLRGLGNERIVSYRIIGGKIYFSANPKYGECQNPSQANVQKLSSALSGLAGLAAMLGGMNDGPVGISDITGDDAEDETEEYDSALDSITFENGKRIYGNGYSLCLPAGCSDQGETEEHDVDIWYPEGSSLDDYLLHFVVRKPELKKEMEPFSADLTFSLVQLVTWQIYDQFKDIDRSNGEVIDVEGNGVKGALFVSGGSYLVQLAVPGGMQTLRIDNGDCCKIPKNLIKKMIRDWINTYQCERSFPVQEPFNSEKYLSPAGRTEFVDNVNLEARLLISHYGRRNEIAEHKCNCLGSAAYRSATKLIIQERAEREDFAANQSVKLAELLEAVKYYKSIGLSEEEYFAVAHVVQTYLLGIAPVSYINLPKGNIGAYDSSTDIKIGANSETVPVAICAMPEHYEELFELVSTAVPIGEKADEFRDISSNIKQILYSFHHEQNVTYNTEFKMEGSMLAAYLGDAEHVTIPEGVTAISDTAFANCKILKTVEIPEGVTSIGYAAFENCPNLQSITMPDSLTSMFPAPFGYNVSEKKNTPKFIVYKGSYAENFAKENKIPYEIIKEDDLDTVFSYKEGRRDTVAGLSILVPDGFYTTEQLSAGEKRSFKQNERTEHLYYAAVSADAKKDFSEYKNVAASISIAGKLPEYKDAADENNVEFILGGLNVSHRGDTFRIETLRKNKLVVAYDVGNSGVENGIPWVMYPTFVFTSKYIIPIQFFFNDFLTERQHTYAVKQWLLGIEDEAARIAEERARKREEERKQKAEEERKRKEEEQKRKAEAEAAAARKQAEIDAKYKPVAERKRKYQYRLKGMMCAIHERFVCTTEDGCPYKFVEDVYDREGKHSDISKFFNIKSIVVTEDGIVGLRKNGTCISTDPGYTYSYIQDCNSWSKIKQIASGDHHVVGLREDGTCVANRVKWNTGYGYDGQCNVAGWRDIKYITCGGSFTVGLKYDGSVVVVGETEYSHADVAASWKDIELIEAYGNGVIAVDKYGKIHHTGKANISYIASAKNIVDIAVCRGVAYALLADGTVAGKDCKNIKDVVALAAGVDLFLLKKDGRIEIKRMGGFRSGHVELPASLRLINEYNSFIDKVESEENAVLEERRLKKEKEEARKNKIYEDAVSYIGSGEIKKCKEAEKLLSSIVGWKDSANKLAILRNEIAQLEAEAAAKNAKKRKPVLIAGFVVLALIAAVFLFFPQNSGSLDSEGNDNDNVNVNDSIEAVLEDSTVENKGEFVAITMNSIKRVDSDSLTITLKEEAPIPANESIVEHANGYPIVFAEKIVKDGNITYTAIKGDNLIKCTKGIAYAKSNYREEAAQNYGMYGERNDAYTIYVYNLFAEEIGTYTYRYGNQSVKVKIELPELGLYSEPEATVANQYFGDLEKGDVVYMILTEPELYKHISFNVLEEDDQDAVKMEPMGEYGEICKITALKSGSYIRTRCVREFNDGSRDDSGFGIVIK